MTQIPSTTTTISTMATYTKATLRWCACSEGVAGSQDLSSRFLRHGTAVQRARIRRHLECLSVLPERHHCCQQHREGALRPEILRRLHWTRTNHHTSPDPSAATGFVECCRERMRSGRRLYPQPKLSIELRQQRSLYSSALWRHPPCSRR